jgi:hypothetical protein
MCLKETLEGFPIHPLYVAAKTQPVPYLGPDNNKKTKINQLDKFTSGNIRFRSRSE